VDTPHLGCTFSIRARRELELNPRRACVMDVDRRCQVCSCTVSIVSRSITLSVHRIRRCCRLPNRMRSISPVRHVVHSHARHHRQLLTLIRRATFSHAVLLMHPLSPSQVCHSKVRAGNIRSSAIFARVSSQHRAASICQNHAARRPYAPVGAKPSSDPLPSVRAPSTSSPLLILDCRSRCVQLMQQVTNRSNFKQIQFAFLPRAPWRAS
jgi:hypothetical protein